MQAAIRTTSAFELALAVWRRRKWVAILVFAAALSASLSVVRGLPDIYQSTATVLVERQQVPERFVRSSVTGERETRLHAISQEILSRSRLYELITRFGLYPELRARETPEALVKRMRQDIRLEFKEVPHQWGQGPTIAFTLGYRGRDPETVARVTNTLAALYVEEDARIRQRQTTGTTEFLKAQLDEVKDKLEAQARRTGEFKERHIGELPEQQGANLAALERLNAQLRLNSDRQLRAMERREELAKQLAESPDPAGGPDRLTKLRQELAALRTQFGDKYPNVVRVKAEIAVLERQLAEAPPDGARRADPLESPGRRLRDALAETEAEMTALRNEEKTLRQAIAAYDRRVENAPRREQEFQQLSREYATIKELHDSLLKRYQDAQLAESMEQRHQGEQFRILDPALPPTEPAAPNRFRLLLVGLTLSLGLAAGAVILAETRDTSFHSVDELRAFSTVPVLVSIPPIATAADVRRRRQRFCLAALGAMLGLALIAGASAYFAHDNEELLRHLTRGRF